MSTRHDDERLSALCRKVKNQRKEIKNLNKALRLSQAVSDLHLKRNEGLWNDLNEARKQIRFLCEKQKINHFKFLTSWIKK